MASNVLLVVLDTVRAANCSLYGYDRQTTPGLEALRSECVRFDHAIAPATWTVPSHAAMFTGRYPSDIGVHARNKVLPEGEATAATELRDSGYETAIMSSNPFLTEGTDLHRGYDHRYTAGMRRALFDDAFDPAKYIKTRENEAGIAKVRELLGELASPPQQLPKNVLNAIYYKYRTTVGGGEAGQRTDPASDDGAAETIEAFGRWIPTDGPFHACLNFMEAHTPYRHRKRFLPEWASTSDLHDLDQGREPYFTGEETLDDRAKEILTALYDAEIRYLDEQLQSLWQYLKANDLWDDTLVIVTSDHGEYLGEDGYIFHHSNLLGESLVHVPLLVKYPENRNAGATVEETVSLSRIYDTIVSAGTDATGVDPLAPKTESRLVRSEFVCLDPQHSTDTYVDPYRQLDVPSRAVYEDGTKYLLFDDGRAYTFEAPNYEGSIFDREPGDVDDVPTRIREFANLDVDVAETDDIELSEAVEDRLEELGYR